jgi:hypothetical protein
MKRKDIVNNVRAILRENTKINGHFDSTIYDLGNRKFGVDIFVISVRGTADNKYLRLDGVYKNGAKILLESLGVFYKKINENELIIYKEENIISLLTTKEIKDLLNDYLHQLPLLKVDINGTYETFTKEAQIEAFYRQMNLVLNDSFLEFLELETSPILRDQAERGFLCFANGVVDITVDNIVLRKKLFGKNK